MNTPHTYDIIGIGIGPFNLGLAALLQPVGRISAVFFDQAPGFDWHPGLMLSNATLQVPFMADLVTMADPTSEYSFLNYLKQSGRLYKFYIREDFFILRKEYNAYCKWVAERLPSCRFSHKVVAVQYEADRQLYAVSTEHTLTGKTALHYTRKLVLGTGTQPYMPAFAKKGILPDVIHTSAYLNYKDKIGGKRSVTVIGSGQSAAEVFADLLPLAAEGMQLNWFTRPDRFFPMEYSKLTLELTSPEYVDYFYSIPAAGRQELLSRQNPLFKGINYDLINQIFDTLYEMSVDKDISHIELRPNVQLNDIRANAGNSYTLDLTQVQQQRSFTRDTDFVILATGYKYREPAFLEGISDRIVRREDQLFDVQRNYAIDLHGDEIFVQNAELHTHGFVTPDLGMGAYRNSCIINTIAGEEIYHTELRIAFQQFGVETSIPAIPAL
ncbi:lysine N(6)-hydroxylase/L-ornithine N(5)-oxygenase family protein [Chitinophaga filiformis]|uniref:SidA/IucD/PvdA family monooxygenase n=1 Tax=Chitinophaga filiformis TaxID=104663 RepID=A0ABY4I7Z1_CHIFI|nr:SidA/IucD/PvdA family monooxygenase [Chitinophaga filiformis]UPK71982.1 SidA/IucD/PvdA family monooxygenase [Chitinophaga filiformis]